MLILDDGRTVVSASDLTAASECEFGVLRGLDRLLGRTPSVPSAADVMFERVAELGDAHETATLERFFARFGAWDGSRGVAMVSRPVGAEHRSAAALAAKHDETLGYLRSGADVIYQGTFFDGSFVGRADFLVRLDVSWQVQDTKLARSAKVEALLQLAAYADQLAAAGLPVADEVALVLGSGVVSGHRTADLVPVYRDRMARLRALVDTRASASGPLAWDTDGVVACLRCESCAPFVEETRDLILVAGLRTSQRDRLRAAGIRTVEELAASSEEVRGIGLSTLSTLRKQAALQARQDALNLGRPESEPATVCWEIVDEAAVHALPAPDPGDIFFDFEGDPLWLDPTPGAGDAWGLEYLFGVVEAPVDGAPPVFRPFWAHDRAGEKAAMVEFMAYVAERRAAHPGMHVYHYAPYERSALLRLAGRHGVAEEALDQMLREGVLVDLYATVRAGLRTGQRSYSLKKVEAVYAFAHTGAVAKADESIVAYARACARRDEGDQTGWDAALQDIADYNRDDCLSTMQLRDWLRTATGPHAATPIDPVSPDHPVDDEAGPDLADDELARSLMAFADPPTTTPPRDPDRQAVAMLAAALGYHWREEKPFWWAHFDRLSSDPSEWTDKRATLVIDDASVVQDWHVPARARTQKRHLRVTGRLEAGSDLKAGAQVYGLFTVPAPETTKVPERALRGWRGPFEVLAVARADDAEIDVLTVEEGGIPVAGTGHAELPMALVPAPGPSTDSLRDAIRTFGGAVTGGLPTVLSCAVTDLLRRVPPRTSSGAGVRPVSPDVTTIEAIVETVKDLDASYLAVQGPPGTGKTYIGARVVKALVEAGWRVGVVAQSHAVVENFLNEALTAGVPAARVGKKPVTGAAAAAPWTPLKPDFAPFFAAHEGGFLVGGTAWDFTNARRIPERGYDLLVVDEAGQFALANTIAVAGAAERLLLLGDPQQLPQVSQGTHPEPVDESALGWLSAGHDTLPDTMGYFLPTTFRMHHVLCEAVSALSYEGRLTSHPVADARRLDGVAPGVEGVPVVDVGCTVVSQREAEEVVRQVRDVVGRAWTDEHGHRPLGPADVIVVAAYNAQVGAIRRALDSAGYRATQVGTVDKFQGRQAPVALLSMAASSPADVPRGMDFLLDRNRLNVAISRGKWCARIIYSPALTDYLPPNPAQLAQLGAFLRLVHGLRG